MRRVIKLALVYIKMGAIQLKGRAAVIIILAMLLNGCEKTDNKDREITVGAEIDNNISTTDIMQINTEIEAKAESTTIDMVTTNIENSEKETQQKSDGIKDEQVENILEDIVFIGDSVTSGFGGYQKVDMSKVFATPCVAPSNIKDFSFTYGDTEYAALTILSFEQPEYAVISMGLNDINTYSPENFSELYMKFVKEAMIVCPNCEFYIMSITPVSADCEDITNETIDKVNSQLEKTVSGHESGKLHYVDCSSPLKDENGNMSEEYSSGDGIHLNSGAYDIMLDKLRDCIS